ncbi:LOW QUALITY PROTEIN: cilia- and flagella-associated protein 43 [Manduca sexta]|uniref:LOW QUALITY PROTEIN: cilia- and flagella-associated protein 43 n=1 Tax=Manduca sexta TaxID=7130 RepID=UPI00188FC285|nr:LOW QUALITY PROTEIN: cilia- and flagella-associated protein 43 [Manduca sexta]
MTEEKSETLSNDKTYDPKVRWVIPQRLDFMTFIGKDVLAVAHDIYIVFLNLKTHVEHVYVANDVTRGDGVDVVAGHRTNLFAFAEKVKNARIFIVTYPSFNIITELKDTDVNRYKGLCLMECDLVAGFSGFPDYLISVWNWRTKQRLISLPTGVIRRSQIYMASRSHMLICECWGEGLIVWEVAQCYKKCFMLKRPKEEKTGWEVSVPPLVGVCWSNEGQLYAIDPSGNLYGVLSDGIGMVTQLEWSEERKGTRKPSVCTFGNGMLLHGPDNCLRSLKKSGSTWKVVFTFIPHDDVVRLLSNSTNDVAAMWTSSGLVYRITGDEDKVHVNLFTHKQRNITKVQMIAPDYTHLATIDDSGVLCIYEILSTKLVLVKFVEGEDISFQASPMDPLLIVYGRVDTNYGMALFTYSPEGLEKVGSVCLTNQIVSEVVFSPTGRELVAAAMSAGHIFIYKLSEDYKLTLVRYTELGRGLADCFLMRVGDAMRSFSLVLFSDKYAIGERIICINAESGKDNKFAGKMQGPYQKLLPLSTKDTMLAIPHLSKQFHVLKLSGDKGVTVSVKMGPIIDSGHDIKSFMGFLNFGALLTYGYDGTIIFRQPDAPEEYELKLITSHRYESGIRNALVDAHNTCILHLGRNRTLACALLHAHTEPGDPAHAPIDINLFDEKVHTVTIIGEKDKNYLDLQEDKKVHEEAMDYKRQRDEVVKTFESIQNKLVELLEENLVEVPLHQLSLAEFNLHQEHKKERLKQAEKERETIRLETEARIMAQDKVTAWIKKQCWDTMLTPRVKLFAIFSHYQVENYAVLPTQRDNWPELQQIEALRSIEMENDGDLFKPWEEVSEEVASISKSQTEEVPEPSPSARDVRRSAESALEEAAQALEAGAQPHALAASSAHRCVPVPLYMIPQTLAFSFLQMNWLQHIVKLNVQNMRLWFNKQFDDLMNLKKREVGLVEERNARLRFIIEELNKLSDLRGSFHHLTIEIKNPEWRQEEQPLKLIKVEPEECSIEPYISPSQIVIIPPDPGPKDDFRERALMDMMDGVLEKLWHEEIKKPIPMPQCMLDKEPEHFNEDDLRLVFDYEAKVAFRNEERDKYRKMLHAEYAKLSQLLNESIVKFNQKVKDMWLTKLKTDSVIGQENLSLMRLRRVNLDRVEMAEKLEDMRAQIAKYERETAVLTQEQQMIQEQSADCQASYETLTIKDKYMERTFKNHFADLSPIIVDQCYKFFKKRPKWHQRATMIPVVLYDLANAVLSGVRPPLLHPDCLEFFKGVEQLDLLSNMPPVIDEVLWGTMCKLRRAKIENEIRMRAVGQEMAYVDSANNVWTKAIQARRNQLAALHDMITQHRHEVEVTARNKTIQLVLPAGQVEITTTGHIEDYEDATLILREDIEKINNVILKVGDMKLRMMRKQMDFRKGILSKEWEHAQMKMRLRHMEQELYSYQRLKIPKELQLYLKNKELGYTDEQDYVRMEKEMEASKMSVNKILNEQIHRVEELELKLNALETQSAQLEKLIANLNVKVSEKRLNEDPLEPIRIRRIFKKRMETLVMRSQLIRDVQANHTTIVLLQTELELLRLKTYPTLASFRTFS